MKARVSPFLTAAQAAAHRKTLGIVLESERRAAIRATRQTELARRARRDAELDAA